MGSRPVDTPSSALSHDQDPFRPKLPKRDSCASHGTLVPHLTAGASHRAHGSAVGLSSNAAISATSPCGALWQRGDGQAFAQVVSGRAARYNNRLQLACSSEQLDDLAGCRRNVSTPDCRRYSRMLANISRNDPHLLRYSWQFFSREYCSNVGPQFLSIWPSTDIFAQQHT